MKYLRACYVYIIEKYDLLTRKKFSTLAGTLVFFLIMSIVPLSFWLTLIIGKLPIDTEYILSLSVFESVKNILAYLRQESVNSTTGASFVLLLTTMYSSTTFFYQMRRSGEIVYDYRRNKKGLHVRIGALVLWTVLMAMIVAFLMLFTFGAFLFSRIIPSGWEKVADYILLSTLSFVLVLLLNMYVCPYKVHIKRFLPGTFITVGAWALALLGFSIYIKIGNVGKLYGALSALIVFFLWLYVLMVCFMIGVIINSEQITKERQQARKNKRKKTTDAV